jgi:hypothetical protein
MPIGRTIICLLGGFVLSSPAFGQAMEAPTDYAGTGYFRDQDTLPGSYRFYQQLPGGEAGLWGMGPSHPKLLRSSFKIDAHDDVIDYSPRVLCQKCHQPQTKDLHYLRMGIACVQCHRSSPVAGVYQYYSPLNPIRRHAYVCAKCHEGATPSFASYMVHEPNPVASEARGRFPLLYYTVWFMLILAGGVFAIFLPYTLFWWIRDLVAKLARRPSHGS